MSRRRAGLVALLTADLLSALGNWVSMIVLPWLVLENTGSPAKMGLVAVAELVPYLASGVFAAPLADRLGSRRTSLIADIGSALAMAAIAVVPRIDYLAVLIIVAGAGVLRGVGDRVKHVMLAPMAAVAGVPMIRITALYETLTRGAQLVGAPLGGLLIFWLGTQPAIWVDAASFLACAALVGLFVRPRVEPTDHPRERYLTALAGGARQLWGDRLLFAMTAMVFLTNVLSQASTSVLIPVWVAEQLGTPAALGLVLSAFATGAVLGSLAFVALATKLPRHHAFAVGLVLSGAPRLFVLGTDSLALVLVITFLSGLGLATVNPIYGALLYDRVPAELQTRVFGLVAAATYGGLPVGAALAGLAVAGLGLHSTILLGGTLYLATILIPLRQLRHAANTERISAKRS